MSRWIRRAWAVLRVLGAGAAAAGCVLTEFNNPEGFALSSGSLSPWASVSGSLLDAGGSVLASHGAEEAPRISATTGTLQLSGLEAGARLAFYFSEDCSGEAVAGGTVGEDGDFSATLDLSGLAESEDAQQLYATLEADGQMGECELVGIGLVIDRTAPTLANLSDDATPARSKTWSWECSQACTWRYVVDGSPTGDPAGAFGSTGAVDDASGTTTYSTGDGTKYLHIQVMDEAGNLSPTTTVSAVLDNTPPAAPSAPTLVTAPSTSNDTTPTVQVGGVVSGSAVKLFTNSGCTAVSQVGTGTASGATIDLDSGTLADGSYTFYATATDPAGNVSPCSSGGAAYILDSTPPVVTGLSDDASATRSKTWTWSCSGGPCTFTYLVDTSAGTDAGSTYDGTTTTTQATGTGSYHLHVRAQDAAGNISAQVNVSAILDNTAPVPGATPVSIASGAAHTYARSQSVAFSATGATTMCIATNADCSACSDEDYAASKTVSFTGTGTKHVSIKFKDAAGNESACAADSIELTDVDGGPEPYVSGKGSFFDRVYSGDGSDCETANGASKWSDCGIGGSFFKFPTRLTSCAGLTLTDSRSWVTWSCELQGGYAIFAGAVDLKNSRFTDFMNLAGPSAPSWKTATLTLNDGAAHTGSANAWWTDGIQPLPASTGAEHQLSSSKTFYVATSSMSTRGYELSADQVGIVAPSGVTLTWDSGGAVNCHQGAAADSKKCVISGNNVDRSIVQIDVDGASQTADFGILLSSTSEGVGQVISGAKISSLAESGLLMEAQTLSWIYETTVDSSKIHGFELNGLIGVRLEEVSVQSVTGPGGGYGISFSGGLDNVMKSAVVANTALRGLSAFSSIDLVAEDLRISNTPYGVQLDSADGAVLSGLLVGDTTYGIDAVDSSNVKLFRSTVVRSGDTGIRIRSSSGASDNILIDNALVGSAGTYGLSFTDASNVTILNAAVAGAGTSEFRVEDVTTLEAMGNIAITRGANGCSLSGTNTAVDFADAGCSGDTGDPVNDWNLETGLSLANAFMSAPGVEDAVNSTSALSSTNRVSHGSITDWLTFLTPWRLWGDQGNGTGSDVMGQSVASANCVSGETCQIWEYSLKLGSSVTRRTAAFISTNAAFTSGAACPGELTTNATVTLDGQTGLRLAVEDLGDGKGDDDGICETTESCLYLQNFGYFQGEFSSTPGYCAYPAGTYQVLGFPSAGFNVP